VSSSQDLVDRLKGELGGTFEALVVGLLTPPLAYDVSLLRNAIKVSAPDEMKDRTCGRRNIHVSSLSSWNLHCNFIWPVPSLTFREQEPTRRSSWRSSPPEHLSR